MTVYIIWQDWATINEDIHSVWSSKEKAEKFKSKLDKNTVFNDKYRIDEWIVDSLED